MLRLIAWLPDTGAFVASLQGGRDWLGWGTDRAVAVWHADAAVAGVMAGTRKKAPVFPTPKRGARR